MKEHGGERQGLAGTLRRLWRRFGALLAVLALVAVAAGWTGFSVSRKVDGALRYTIWNDEYTAILPLTEKGLRQQFSVPQGLALYGVRLHFSTYDAVPGGAVTAELAAADGTVLGRQRLEASTLLDNTFRELVFSQEALPLAACAGEDGRTALTLTVAAEGAASGAVGLWYSPQAAAALDGSSLHLEGGGALALQLVTANAAQWFRRILLIPAGLLLAGAAALWFLRKRGSGHGGLFLAAGLALGLTFIWVTPPMVAPDEYAHLARSYAMASSVLGQPGALEGGRLAVRAADAPYWSDKTGEVGIFAYQTMAVHLADGAAGPADTPVPARISAGPAFLFWPQTVGILAGRLAGRGFFALLALGRLCDLAVYLGLAALALRVLPRGRTLLAAVALLPMSLQLAASLSPDALILGLGFLFISLVVRHAQPGAKGGPAQLLLLMGLALALGAAKAVYAGLALAVLAIPAAAFGGRGKKLAGCGLVLAASLAGLLAASGGYLRYVYRDVDYMGVQRFAARAIPLALLVALAGFLLRRRPRARAVFWACVALGLAAFLPVGYRMLANMWGGLTPDEIAAGIAPNGDSIYTFTIGYVCRNIPQTLRVLAATLATQGPSWLEGVLGLALGEPIVYTVKADWLLGLGLVLVLLVSALPVAGAERRLTRGQAALFLAVFGGVVTLSLLACLTWTPINYDTLFGVQGRYFLPALPLALLAAGEQRLVLKARSMPGALLTAQFLLSAGVVLQGLAGYAIL